MAITSRSKCLVQRYFNQNVSSQQVLGERGKFLEVGWSTRSTKTSPFEGREKTKRMWWRPNRRLHLDLMDLDSGLSFAVLKILKILQNNTVLDFTKLIQIRVWCCSKIPWWLHTASLPWQVDQPENILKKMILNDNEGGWNATGTRPGRKPTHWTLASGFNASTLQMWALLVVRTKHISSLIIHLQPPEGNQIALVWDGSPTDFNSSVSYRCESEDTYFE